MGLAFILAAFHLFPSPGRRKLQDTENSADAERQAPDDEQAVDDDEDEAEEDDGTEDPLANTGSGPRLHRLSSATARTFFSTRMSRSFTFDSLSNPHKSLLSRMRSVLFPPDESESTLEKFLPNYRWTPILSGVVIPFSILLEIPGLTEHWYVRTEANKVVETRNNAVILDVGLAFSMTCALFANICLVLRFLEKRVRLVTLLTIFFLTVHDVINIVCVTTFGVAHRADDGFTYGQSFWLTLCSTVSSTVCNITLITDFVRTPSFARSGSGLTRKQRALMIIVIVLLVYIALGALVNSFIQGLNFIDGLYFTVVTIETIGFGDITPNTTGARIFTCLYMVFGILNLGVAVAMTRETVLEGLDVGYRKRLRDLRLRRREARRFRRWDARWRRAVEWRLKELGQPVWVSDAQLADEQVHFVGIDPTQEPHWAKRCLRAIGLGPSDANRGVHGFPHGKHLNIDALSPQQLEAAALEAGVPLDTFLVPRRRRSSLIARTRSDSSGARQPDPLSARNWPTHAQTPTHAQVGRMAAVVTQFAVAVAGARVSLVGHDAGPSRRDGVGGVRKEGNGIGTEQQADAEKPEEPPGLQQGATLGSNGGLMPSVSQWTKDLARDRSQSSHVTYEQFKKDIETEERRAYWAKLGVAWTLFLGFWMVGSAIFSATEGWTYGIALYFCVIAFTTTGYGDYTPTSPAGRSVFVVWALLGVATMTILISVLEEAGSNRYKRALHSKTFDNAVKKYRKRESEITSRIAAYNTPHIDRTSSVHAAEVAAQRELEGLPNLVIRQMRIFHNHMRYFVNKSGQSMPMLEGASQDGRVRIPNELKDLLDEISQFENIGDRTKREILEDTASRNTLLMLSIERTLRTLVNSAERALVALAERDDLIEAKQPREEQQSATQTQRDIHGRDFASV